jgi:hypothetical protein
LSPDSYLLPVAELTLLRAFVRIAGRLGVSESAWDLSARSPFSDPAGGDITTSTALLPPNWQPTSSQLFVSHHPLLDLLPWPSARDKIIGIFSLPEAARPPAAAGPLALVQFAYDMEDSYEGMRVWGGDPYDAASWEVGQVLFEKWWFIFDCEIIDQSNRWRRLRGAGGLKMKSEIPRQGIDGGDAGFGLVEL